MGFSSGFIENCFEEGMIPKGNGVNSPFSVIIGNYLCDESRALMYQYLEKGWESLKSPERNLGQLKTRADDVTSSIFD
jgi:hypothetical protein